jgi:multiple sugar transport system permease protein
VTEITAARPATSYTRSRRKPLMRWLRFALLCIFGLIVCVPVIAVVIIAFHPSSSGVSSIQGWTLTAFTNVIDNTNIPTALVNSFVVGIVSTVLSVAVGALGGYVVSRVRNRFIGGYSLLLFVLQALPQVVFVIPLFILFARIHLVNSLPGVAIVYISASIAVVTWMMAAYFDSIPRALEEAAWVDGLNRLTAFLRIVLRNAGPGIMSASVFGFLVAWNDFLVASVFLKTTNVQTMPVAIQQFFQENSTDWPSVMASAVLMIIPPTVLFCLLGRRFSIGGIAGSISAR